MELSPVWNGGFMGHLSKSQISPKHPLVPPEIGKLKNYGQMLKPWGLLELESPMHKDFRIF